MYIFIYLLLLNSKINIVCRHVIEVYIYHYSLRIKNKYNFIHPYIYIYRKSTLKKCIIYKIEQKHGCKITVYDL